MKTERMTVRHGLALSILFSTTALTGVAHAEESAVQPAQGTTAAQSPSSDAADSGEIVVTAQKQSQALREVPIAVTAITPQAMSKLGLSSVTDLQLVTPGASFQVGSGINMPYIRGIGSLFIWPGLESGVSIYHDGAYLPRTIGMAELLDMTDPGTIQVLRGPQGTLYGRNATGGVIILDSANPVMESAGNIGFEYGSNDRKEARLMFNMPLAENIAFRVAARYRDTGDFVRNIVNGDRQGGTESYVVRAKLLWQPSDRSEILLGFEYQNSNARWDISIGDRDAPTCYACSLVPGLRSTTDGFRDARTTRHPDITNDFYAGTLKMKFDFGAVDATSTTTYRKQRNYSYSDQDFTNADFFNFTVPNTGGTTWTQDLTLASHLGGRIEFLGGVSYIHDRGVLNNEFSGAAYAMTLPVFGQYPNVFNIATTKSYAAFLEGYFKVTDQIKLTVGGRYTHDDRHLEGWLNAAFASLFGASTAHFNQKVSFSAFTPRAVLAWDNGSTNIYYSYTEGFKAGGLPGPALFPTNVVKPEKIRSHEIGIKQSAFNNTLRLNIAAFYYKNKNLQVQIIDNASGGNITQNAGALENYGIEAEAQWVPTPGLTIGFNLAYQHARYKPFLGAAVNCYDPATVPALTSCRRDATGTAPPNAPDWSGSINASYDFNIGGWGANLSGIARSRSEISFFTLAGGPLRHDREPGYWMVNVTGYVSPPNMDGLRLGFYVTNLLNEQYATYRSTSQPWGTSYEPGRGREAGGRISYTF